MHYNKISSVVFKNIVTTFINYKYWGEAIGRTERSWIQKQKKNVDR